MTHAETSIVGSEQRVAVMTGASQAIGAGLVNGFLGRGYRVVANSRTIQPDAAGSPDVLTIAGDVTDRQTAERIVGAAIDRFGRIDTLVNNAGIFVSKPFVGYADADFAALLSVTLAGFF
jgi:NAD(P)-dependent dehydrogenase (short-subunit alcohol dehydrogenase family)